MGRLKRGGRKLRHHLGDSRQGSGEAGGGAAQAEVTSRTDSTAETAAPAPTLVQFAEWSRPHRDPERHGGCGACSVEGVFVVALWWAEVEGRGGRVRRGEESVTAWTFLVEICPLPHARLMDAAAAVQRDSYLWVLLFFVYFS